MIVAPATQWFIGVIIGTKISGALSCVQMVRAMSLLAVWRFPELVCHFVNPCSLTQSYVWHNRMSDISVYLQTSCKTVSPLISAVLS